MITSIDHACADALHSLVVGEVVGYSEGDFFQSCDARFNWTNIVSCKFEVGKIENMSFGICKKIEELTSKQAFAI